MKELHVLVDYENVQPSLEALAKLATGFTDVWLFYGPHQAKQAQAFAGSNERVTLVPRSGKGSNALDFHIAFYLGYVAAKHPDAQLVVVANDRGYDPMLAHARMLKFNARRVGYKVPAAKKAAPVKSAEPIVVAVPAKKTVAKKAVAKKAVAKPAAPKPVTPAKVAAVKKAPATKKAPVAKKAAAKKAAAPKPAKAAQPAKPPKPASAPQVTPEAKTLARIQKGFIKMGSKAPHKVKPFLRHVGALLGKGSTAEQIDAMVAKLEAAGSVWFIGDEVVYGRK
jgi:pyruvate/2-oxoglutarate dehydrogenase complex dihydrolipoamide acyltransferase (E2) component